MFASPGPARLCQSCRYDLLSLFEHGFARPLSTSRPFLPKSRIRPNVYRGFSQSHFVSGAVQEVKRLESDRRLADEVEAEHPEMLQPWEEAFSDEQLPEPMTEQEMGEQKELQKNHALVDENEEEDALRATLSRRAYKGHLRNPERLNPWPETLLEPLPSSADQHEKSAPSAPRLDDVVRTARQRYGEVLPKGALSFAEYAHYLRLYGEPAAVVVENEQVNDGLGEGDSHKVVEEQELLSERRWPVERATESRAQEEYNSASADTADTAPVPEQGNIGVVDTRAAWRPMDTAEVRTKEIAEFLGGEVYINEDEADESYEESEQTDERAHPLTTLGRFATYPRTVFLPQESIIRPVEKMLADYSNKHLKDMCLKTFGGNGLPDSPLTPYSARQRQQLPIPLDATQHEMGQMEANAYLTAVMPPVYATIMAVLTETRKRLGASWLRSLILKEGGPRILDAGPGGAGVLAWNEIVKAEWALLHGSEAAAAAPPPPCKAVVLTGSDTLRHRASALLENTTFVPRLPDYVHTRDSPTLDDSRPIQQRKQFDIIIAPHTLFPLKEEYLRKQHVQNLWSLLSSSGGVLILLEKGIPRGFEAIAGAREMLLERYIASPGSEAYESPLSNSLTQENQITQKGKGMIIAPCTNHNKCPMYTISGPASGRRDFCAFQQRFVRPPYMQRVMEGSAWNHEDVNYSYVSVLKGEDLRDGNITSWEELVDPMAASSKSVAQNSDGSLRRSFAGFEVKANTRQNDPEAVKDETALLMAKPLNTTLPRLIFSPLKRKGHITMDLCTTEGRIERWTVPKSFSKQAYRDARKVRWGDLWALGAKTRVDRNLRCGGSGTKEGRKMERKRRRVVEREEEKREKMEEEALGAIDAERGLRGRKDVGGMDDEEGDGEEEDGDEEIDMQELERALEAAADEAENSIDGQLQAGGNASTDPHRLGTEETPMSPEARKRLLQTLNNAQSEQDVGAALQEWEDEYAADKKPSRNRDSRRRQGRDRSPRRSGM